MNRRSEITTPEILQEDTVVEPSLRPQRLDEFIGQDKVCEALSIALEAAKQRREPLDHLLFHGPPGLGKTTLASLIAREMGVNFKSTSGPVLEKPAGSWISCLRDLPRCARPMKRSVTASRAL